MKKPGLEQAGITRRAFLHVARGAGALGALALLMGRNTGAEAVTEVAAGTDPPATGGYRETEHIRKYYRCARYW